MTDLFGTGAPQLSDLVALFEVVVAVLLLVGMFVVRKGYVRIHMVLQTSMVLVNIPVILAWMVPQYLDYVLPGLPGEISEPFYYVPTLMLVAGVAAELLGIYIILVAATNLVPIRWRFRRYKLWMRTELVLWWSVLLAGLTTYFVWYISGASS
jgi:uncharacterized membrane protein YozB (DUF420 family)